MLRYGDRARPAERKVCHTCAAPAEWRCKKCGHLICPDHARYMPGVALGSGNTYFCTDCYWSLQHDIDWEQDTQEEEE